MFYFPRLQYFASWLLLLGAVLTRVPIPKSIAWVVWGMGILLLSTSLRHHRFILLLLPFIAVPILATYISLPLPTTWPGLIRLGFILLFWCVIILLVIALVLKSTSYYNARQRTSQEPKSAPD